MSTELRVTTRLQGAVGIPDIAGDVTNTAHDSLIQACQHITSRGVQD